MDDVFNYQLIKVKGGTDYLMTKLINKEKLLNLFSELRITYSVTNDDTIVIHIDENSLYSKQDVIDVIKSCSETICN